MIGNPPPLSDSELRVLEKIADAAAPVQGSVRSRAMQDYRAATGVYNVHRLINQIRGYRLALQNIASSEPAGGSGWAGAEQSLIDVAREALGGHSDA